MEDACGLCRTGPVPTAEGQEVAGDPGRTQALLCVSLSNSHQTLHSNEKQEQAPLTAGALLHPYFTVTSLLRSTFQVVIRGRAAQFNTEAMCETFIVNFASKIFTLNQCFSTLCPDIISQHTIVV